MHRFTKKKFLYPILTFFMTAIVTSYAVYFAYQTQHEHTVSLVDNLAEQQAENLQQIVESDLHFIGAGANFYHSTERADWDRFSVFADQLVAQSETLIGLQWMQKVEREQVESHIVQVRKTFPSFELYTVPKDGPKTKGYIMANNEPIFVASDIFPRNEQNIALLGFYSSRLRFQLVLDGLLATGEPNVSDKVRLLQDGLDRTLKKTGMLVYHPVFDINNEDELVGVVVGVIRTTKYFEGLVQRTGAEQDLLVKVVDMGFDAEDDPVLYQSEQWDETRGIEITKRVTLPNREWLVDFKLARDITDNDKLVLRWISIAGLVIACLLSYIVLLLVREKEHLAILLDERTKELQFMVDHDTLTGLYNRRAFNRILADLVQREQSFSLVGFDIDKFKMINDFFGHIAGDEMLIHVAKIVQEQLSEDEVFVRMGGDEFCIISPKTDSAELFRYLNNIGRIVATSVHQFGDEKIRCTLSIGAAIRVLDSEEEILQAADAQLYKSKQAGRNCVTVAE
ncbi:sensor domain-containing diguanylate cyclase [Vibrio sp. RE86]|uniref:sensor domain-containing diguanylate cyclase n=1 Tax=Vibrio sp. RE86 TaxID=2607605 RepID=UPI00149364C1|nr:sensor domain-containing diguanylate cyclase [Vibrio sp. RE86]NOH80515.1 sensor domain-containing diguanylate cyclase [Vibrio sp. RE86]